MIKTSRKINKQIIKRSKMIRQTSEWTKFHEITQKINAIEILRYSPEKNNSTHNAKSPKNTLALTHAFLTQQPWHYAMQHNFYRFLGCIPIGTFIIF